MFCAGCLLAQDLREAPAGPTMATVCTFHGDTCFATARKVEGQCSRCQTCGQVVKKNYMCQSCFEQMSQWPICPIHRLHPQTRAGSPERAAHQPTPPGLGQLGPAGPPSWAPPYAAGPAPAAAAALAPPAPPTPPSQALVRLLRPQWPSPTAPLPCDPPSATAPTAPGPPVTNVGEATALQNVWGSIVGLVQRVTALEQQVVHRMTALEHQLQVVTATVAMMQPPIQIQSVQIQSAPNVQSSAEPVGSVSPSSYAQVEGAEAMQTNGSAQADGPGWGGQV